MSSQFKMHYVEFTCTYIYVHNRFINSIGRIFFRLAWQKLGDISKEEAMKQFVDIVSNLCPLLQPYVDAHKREKEEQQRKKWVFKLKINLKVTLATLCLAWICGSLQLGVLGCDQTRRGGEVAARGGGAWEAEAWGGGTAETRAGEAETASARVRAALPAQHWCHAHGC